MGEPGAGQGTVAHGTKAKGLKGTGAEPGSNTPKPPKTGFPGAAAAFGAHTGTVAKSKPKRVKQAAAAAAKIAANSKK